jgi:hypothetical protein
MSKYPRVTRYIADFNHHQRMFGHPQIKLLLDQSGIDQLVEKLNRTIGFAIAHPAVLSGEKDFTEFDAVRGIGEELKMYVAATEHNMPELVYKTDVSNDELPNKLWPVQPECYEGCDDPYCPYMH